MDVANRWFDQLGIVVGDGATSPDIGEAARRLAFAWKDVFLIGSEADRFGGLQLTSENACEWVGDQQPRYSRRA